MRKELATIQKSSRLGRCRGQVRKKGPQKKIWEKKESATEGAGIGDRHRLAYFRGKTPANTRWEKKGQKWARSEGVPTDACQVLTRSLGEPEKKLASRLNPGQQDKETF